MLQYQKIRVSDVENNLIEAIKTIGYGEIFGCEIKQEIETLNTTMVDDGIRDLIEWTRTEGISYIDVLTVHQGSPVMAEIDCIVNGFKCRIKTKFPTK